MTLPGCQMWLLVLSGGIPGTVPPGLVRRLSPHVTRRCGFHADGVMKPWHWVDDARLPLGPVSNLGHSGGPVDAP